MRISDLLESNNIIDNKNGWGAVPNNQEVDYLGIRVTMTPKHFIDLAAPLGSEPSDKIAQHLEQGGKIGAPFLQIEIPESWEAGDFTMPARVMAHEGRNRMAAAAKVFGNNPIETHLFFNKGLRNRHITDEFKKNLNRGLIKEKSKSIIQGPFFSLTESLKIAAEAFDTDVKWIKGAAPQGASVFAAKVDDAYIEITYKPVSKGVYISFTRGARMSVTGEGSQNKIFGAVINHIKKWVDTNKPQEIYFSAFKPRTGAFGSQDITRSGLYRKMVQRFASQNGYDYDVEDGGNEDTFILKRKENNTQTTEALDQPYPVEWNLQADDEWFAWAKDNKIQIQIKTSGNSRWTIRFKVNETMDKTGAGDEFRTFATVKAAIQQWWAWASKNAEVDVITFSAEKIVDASRSRLYNRFAQQFARAIGYEFEVVSGRASDIFYIKNPDLEENSNGKEIAVHRSSEKFSNIDLNKSADGTFWLAAPDADWDNIVTTGKGIEHAYEISSSAKLASWDHIDKYSIDELENMGYDGVRMVDGKDISYQIWNTDILSKINLGETVNKVKPSMPANAARYTTMEWACIEGGHDLNDLVEAVIKPKYETTIYHSLINKKYKHGDYAKSTGKIPPAKPGRTAHPLHGKLVG